MRATIHLAVAANLALAAAFAILHFVSERRRAQGAAPTPAGTQNDEPAAALDGNVGQAGLGTGHGRLLRAAVAVSGLVSFSCEVLWTRLLAFRFEAIVYAFSVMLTAFLLGLGLGSATVGFLRWTRPRSHYWRVLDYLQAAVGVTGMATIFLLFAPRIPYHSFAGRALAHLGVSLIVMTVPTILLGAAFPIACHLYAASVRETGRSVGRIYVFNTAGCIVGALLTGFYLVRALGTQGTLTAASFLMVASGSAVVAAAPGTAVRRAWRPLPAMRAAAFIVSATPSNFLQRYHATTLAVAVGDPALKLTVPDSKEDAEGIATVFETPEHERGLSVGTTVVAGANFSHRVGISAPVRPPDAAHPAPSLGRAPR